MNDILLVFLGGGVGSLACIGIASIVISNFKSPAGRDLQSRQKSKGFKIPRNTRVWIANPNPRVIQVRK